MIVTIEGPETVPQGLDAVYTVKLTGTASTQVIVDYAVRGTATAGLDYKGPAGGTVTLSANTLGATTSFTLETNADETVGETMVVQLTGAEH